MQRPSSNQSRQGGAVAIIVALSIAVLLGFGGLALDSGQLFVSKTELQNAADACALSASAALTGASANQLVIAENYGRTAGQANRVGFQQTAVQVAGTDVTFSQTLNGAYYPRGAIAAADVLKMKFARCTLARTGIKTWLIQVLNVLPGVSIGDQAVASMGAATLQPSQTSCALPVAICAGATPFAKGQWIEGAVGAKDNLTGDFKWVNYIKANSAKDIKDILTGAGVCNLPATGEKVGAPGGKGSEAAAWNTRFGIYAGGYSGPAEGVPDETGYAYTAFSWPAKANAYAGASPSGYPNFKTARASYAAYQGDGKQAGQSGLKTNGSAISSATHRASGSDRRLGIVPVVNCADFNGGSHEAAIQRFACVLMLHPLEQGAGGGSTRMFLEYLGESNDPASPCASVGLPGSSTSVGPLVPVLVQ